MGWWRPLALSLLLFGVASGAQAGDPDEYKTPPCSELNAAWARYRKQFTVAGFPKGAFLCPSEAANIAEAFYLIEHVKFHPQPGTPAPPYYAWLKHTVKYIAYDPAHDGKFAVANEPFEGDVTIHADFSEIPLYQRAAVLIHEGRHLGGERPHVVCKHGRHEGQETCDPYFALDGTGWAYSYGFNFMLWLARHSNYPYIERYDILALLRWELYNRYNDLDKDSAYQFAKYYLGD